MASGDRIELLTANTFENAMDSQEAILNNVYTKVNTIHTNVEQSLRDISTAYTTMSRDISTVYQTETTNYSVLSDLSTKLGSSNNTGGTATAGTVMAKLNSIINAVNSIQTSTGNSLNTTVFVPNETNLLKTILNTSTTTNTLLCVGTFVAKYSGTICIKATGHSASDTGTYYGRLIAYANMYNAGVTLYPTMPKTNLSETSAINSDSSAFLTFKTLTQSTSTAYLQVRAGDIVYMVLRGFSSSACICSNISVYGTATSYY